MEQFNLLEKLNIKNQGFFVHASKSKIKEIPNSKENSKRKVL